MSHDGAFRKYGDSHMDQKTMLKAMKTAGLLIGVAALTACSTVKMPSADFLRLPEFREAAAKLIEGYPDVSQAPTRPEDIRSAAEWDAAARDLIAKQAALKTPMDGAKPMTEAELDAEVERLKAQIRRYKLDDPQ